MKKMQLFDRIKLALLAVMALLCVFLVAKPVSAFKPEISLPETDIDFLYEPRQSPVIISDFRDIKEAYDAISDIPGSTQMRIPIPSNNPKEKLIIEGVYDRKQKQVKPITVDKVKDMFTRAPALRIRDAQRKNSSISIPQSNLIADANPSALAQYEICEYVDARGVDYQCVVDVILRDMNTNQQWILPNVSVYKLWDYVLNAVKNRTWF